MLANVPRELLPRGHHDGSRLGSNDDEGIVLRQAVELGLRDGPRILCCGRIISATAPGGWICGTM